MVGPKNQDFWPKINILSWETIVCIVWIQWMSVCQKLGMILKNKVVQKMCFQWKRNKKKSISYIGNWHWMYNFETFWKNKSHFIHKNTMTSFNYIIETNHLWNSTTELTLTNIKPWPISVSTNSNITLIWLITWLLPHSFQESNPFFLFVAFP